MTIFANIITWKINQMEQKIIGFFIRILFE